MLARPCAAGQTRRMPAVSHSPVPSGADPVIRIVGAVLALVFAIPFAFCTWVALSSRFSWAGGDVHGYGLIFGTALAVVAGLLVMLTAPLALPRRMRARGYVVALLAYLVVAILLLAALFTA